MGSKTFVERLGSCEHEQPTAEVVPKVVEVRRDGVCTSAEVKVVGKVHSGVTEKLGGNP